MYLVTNAKSYFFYRDLTRSFFTKSLTKIIQACCCFKIYHDAQCFPPFSEIAADIYLFRWCIAAFCPAIRQYPWFANSSYLTLCLVCYSQASFWIVPFNFRINNLCKIWKRCLDVFLSCGSVIKNKPDYCSKVYDVGPSFNSPKYTSNVHVMNSAIQKQFMCLLTTLCIEAYNLYPSAFYLFQHVVYDIIKRWWCSEQQELHNISR